MELVNDSSEILETNIGSERSINKEKLREYSITNKEEEIISEISMGYSYKKIAENQNISLNTVQTHIYRIYNK